MYRVNETPRQRETEGDRERKSVCEYTKKTSIQFYPKKPSSREVFRLVQMCAESVPKSPVATAPTICQRRVLAERLLSPSPATPPPTFASFLKCAASKTHASLAFPFRFSASKRVLPSPPTHCKRRRVKIHAPPPSRERPLLSSRAKTDDDEQKRRRW